jgi:hypothetical protein
MVTGLRRPADSGQTNGMRAARRPPDKVAGGGEAQTM